MDSEGEGEGWTSTLFRLTNQSVVSCRMYTPLEKHSREDEEEEEREIELNKENYWPRLRKYRPTYRIKFSFVIRTRDKFVLRFLDGHQEVVQVRCRCRINNKKFSIDMYQMTSLLPGMLDQLKVPNHLHPEITGSIASLASSLTKTHRPHHYTMYVWIKIESIYFADEHEQMMEVAERSLRESEVDNVYTGVPSSKEAAATLKKLN